MNVINVKSDMLEHSNVSRGPGDTINTSPQFSSSLRARLHSRLIRAKKLSALASKDAPPNTCSVDYTCLGVFFATHAHRQDIFM